LTDALHHGYIVYIWVPTCLIAVRNPWALKNPVIQNVLGRPSKHQAENWVFLSINSVNQKPRVLESQEI